MKRFFAVFDGYRMSDSTLNYSIQLAKTENAHLVGVFLDDFLYHTYSIYKTIISNADYKTVLTDLQTKDAGKRDDSIVSFKMACEKAGVKNSVHRDTGFAIQELQHESMFADCIIINRAESFTTEKQEIPTSFVRDLLSDVQCPVLLVPPDFKPIDNVVLMYDDSTASLHAIKMFSYILPVTAAIQGELYTVIGSHTAPEIYLEGSQLRKEFFNESFPAFSVQVEKGFPEEKIIEHLAHNNSTTLVVLGAYNRSGFSRLLKPSMADILMRNLQSPLFIAHKK